MSRKPVHRPTSLRVETLEDRTTPAAMPAVRSPFQYAGPTFIDNGTDVRVPATPGIAAGRNHTVTVANARLQIRGLPAQAPQTNTSLYTFFNAQNGFELLSPRVAYDPYADRYLVAAIANHTGNNTSSLFVAVSDDSNPNGTWRFHTVPMQSSVVGFTTFGQYMGLGLDEEAVYLTSSQYSAASGGTFRDARIVVLNKGTIDGWYAGETPPPATPTTAGIIDPDPVAANDPKYQGLVPATMYNSATAPVTGVGAFFVAYNGIEGSAAGIESVQLVKLTNPLTTQNSTRHQIDVGDIDNTSTALPTAPQPGTAGIPLDLGRRQVANAVWRNDRLYFGTTVRDITTSRAAAHWFQLDSVGNAVQQQGNIDTAAVAANLHSYHPAVAVDALGNLAVAFNTSNTSNQVRTYYSGRTPNLGLDPINTLRDPILVPNQASDNEYVRRVGGVNPWGPHAAITVAASDRVFWAFGAFAAAKDTTATEPDQGRWGTAAGAFSFNWPPDVIQAISPNSASEDQSLVPPITLDNHFEDLETGEGANLTYSVVGNDNPGLVTVTLAPNGHELEFILQPNQNGVAFITIGITDNGTADAGPATTLHSFVLTVLPVNDAPTANPDSFETNEDTPLDQPIPGVLANDTDIDVPDTLDAIIETQPQFAQEFILFQDGSFHYVPAGNFHGTDTFTYRARDEGGLFSPFPATTVTITVHPVNDAPNVDDDTYNINEDTPLSPLPPAGVLANDQDVDGDAFTAILETPPQHALSFTFNPNGTFNYVPDPDYNGVDTFFYRATDGTATSDTAAKVTINLAPVDDAPRPQDDLYPAFEGQLLTVPAATGVLFNDREVDGQTLTITGNTTAAHGQLNFNLTDGSFTYQPAPNFSGLDTFQYTVTDGITPVTATVTINVQNFDDPPVAAADVFTGAEDSTLNIPAPGVLANDRDVDTPNLTAELVMPPAHNLIFILNPDGSFSYTPEANFFGIDSFTYRARDAAGASSVVTVTLKITPVQDPVNGVDDGPILVNGKPVRINVLSNDTDPDGDALKVQSYTAPGKGRITRNGTGLVYTPRPGASGPDSFTYTVTDQRGNTDTAVVSLSLTDLVAPTATAVRLGFGVRQADLLNLTRSVLPWTGITTVSVVFSEDVNGGTLTNALTIGAAGGNLGTTFSYNAATRTGTWTLNSAFTGVGRLTLRLAAGSVTDLAGNPMARDWTRTIGILPGDYDGNRVVNDADLKALKKKLNKADFYGDLDGSGFVNQADLDIVTNNKGKRLL